MERKVRIAAGVVSALLIAAVMVSCDDDDPTGPNARTYVANLNAAAEGPGVTSAGSGSVTFVDNGTQIDWTMTLTNITNAPPQQ